MTAPGGRHPFDRVECVGGIVRDGAGRFLLVRRANDPGRGQWSIPGGRVEPGEQQAVAVAREVLEETGLSVTVGAAVGTVERAGRGGSTYEITDYLCTPLAPYATPTAGDDATDARWVTAGELTSYDVVAGLVEALRDWGVLARD
jgi:8-oxo-dGTP diphosphatase